MNSKTRAEAVFFVSSFFNSLVFFAPVAILVRTRCGITLSQFFILQALLSFGIFADSGLVPQCRFFKVIVSYLYNMSIQIVYIKPSILCSIT